MNNSPRHIQQKRDNFIMKMKSIQKQLNELKLLAEPNDPLVAHLCSRVDEGIESIYYKVRETTEKLVEDARAIEFGELMSGSIEDTIEVTLARLEANSIVAGAVSKEIAEQILRDFVQAVLGRGRLNVYPKEDYR